MKRRKRRAGTITNILPDPNAGWDWRVLVVPAAVAILLTSVIVIAKVFFS